MVLLEMALALEHHMTEKRIYLVQKFNHSFHT